jgi:hypothetical protein
VGGSYKEEAHKGMIWCKGVHGHTNAYTHISTSTLAHSYTSGDTFTCLFVLFLFSSCPVQFLCRFIIWSARKLVPLFSDALE